MLDKLLLEDIDEMLLNCPEIDFNEKEEDIPLNPENPLECKGNGNFEGIEIRCENCDYFLQCFPNWQE